MFTSNLKKILEKKEACHKLGDRKFFCCNKHNNQVSREMASTLWLWHKDDLHQTCQSHANAYFAAETE